MNYEIVKLPKMIVAGIKVQTDNASEKDPATAKIPTAWSDVFERNYSEPLAAIYTDYASDSSGVYSEVIGRIAPSETDTANNEIAVSIAAGRYAKFRVEGDMPQIVIDAWSAVWQAEEAGQLDRIYTADLELYPADGVVELYIAIH